MLYNRSTLMFPSTHVGGRWLPVLRQVVEACLREVPPLLETTHGRIVTNIKAGGDPTISTELYVEDSVSEMISRQGIEVRLHSEERGLLLDSSDPQCVIFLDPIDGTYLAERGLP